MLAPPHARLSTQSSLSDLREADVHKVAEAATRAEIRWNLQALDAASQTHLTRNRI